MSDDQLLRQVRDELRLWLQQMHGHQPRNATEDSARISPLIMKLDVLLRSEPPPAPKINTWNRHAVTSVRGRVVVGLPPLVPLEPEAAISFAAWLVVGAELATYGADPSNVETLDRFLQHLQTVRDT